MSNGFTIEWIETARLKPAEYNPRKDLQPGDPEYEQIKKSLNEFGLVDPLVVNKDMTVIGGHQRLKVLMEAGFDKVPCSIVDLPKNKEKALNVALNKIAGEWDFPKLKDLLVEIDDGTLDLDAIGWSEDELKELFGRLGPVSDVEHKTLSNRFIVPPFSVLDARQGYWQERKREWLALGIQSELGRGGGQRINTHAAGIVQNDDGTLNYGKPLRSRVSPGGSPRPACDYSNKKRGDGRGRPIGG